MSHRLVLDEVLRAAGRRHLLTIVMRSGEVYPTTSVSAVFEIPESGKVHIHLTEWLFTQDGEFLDVVGRSPGLVVELTAILEVMPHPNLTYEGEDARPYDPHNRLIGCFVVPVYPWQSFLPFNRMLVPGPNADLPIGPLEDTAKRGELLAIEDHPTHVVVVCREDDGTVEKFVIHRRGVHGDEKLAKHALATPLGERITVTIAGGEAHAIALRSR